MKRTTLLVTVGASVLALLAVVVGKGGGMIVIANRVRVVVVMMSALAVAAGLLTLALLAKPAQAQAETITDNDRIMLPERFISCTGEEVQILATAHFVSHTTIDANGLVHTTISVNSQGQGEDSLLKNSLYAHSDPGSGLKYTEFGTFWSFWSPIRSHFRLGADFFNRLGNPRKSTERVPW